MVELDDLKHIIMSETLEGREGTILGNDITTVEIETI
jgi:hypothetical protein